MTTENIIAALYHAAQESEGYKEELFKKMTKDPTLKYDPVMPQMVQLAGIIRELEEDLRKQNAKTGGKSKALAAAKRILGINTKPVFAYPWNEENRQYIMNGYQMICLVDDSRLPLEELPEDQKPADGNRPFDYERVLEGYKENPIELPDLVKLKSWIKVEKAKHKRVKGGYSPVYDFGMEDGLVDAQYLADIMEIMPDAECYTPSRCRFLFFDENGNRALLMGKYRKNQPIEKTQL